VLRSETRRFGIRGYFVKGKVAWVACALAPLRVGRKIGEVARWEGLAEGSFVTFIGSIWYKVAIFTLNTND